MTKKEENWWKAGIVRKGKIMSSTVFAKQISRDYRFYGTEHRTEHRNLANVPGNLIERTLNSANNMLSEILNEIQNAVLKRTETEHEYMNLYGAWRKRMKHDHTYMPVYISGWVASCG